MKRLQSPVFLVNSRLGLFTAAPFRSGREGLHVPRAHLLPKLRCNFAEFLHKGSLKRLWILTSPTCVRLRYGHPELSLGVFLGSVGSTTSPHKTGSSSHLRVMVRRIYLPDPPTCLNLHHQSQAGLPFCVTPSYKRSLSGTGILTRFPSTTPFDLALGTDSP